MAASPAQETFGSMAKQEKIAFILEQVRLCLDKHDYVRAQILAKKVSPKAFAVGTSAQKTELDGLDAAAPGVPVVSGDYYVIIYLRY